MKTDYRYKIGFLPNGNLAIGLHRAMFPAGSAVSDLNVDLSGLVWRLIDEGYVELTREELATLSNAVIR